MRRIQRLVPRMLAKLKKKRDQRALPETDDHSVENFSEPSQEYTSFKTIPKAFGYMNPWH